MAADSQQVAHRPGIFKQPNKSHKTGRHRTKGQVSREQFGRVSAKTLSKHVKKVMGKEARRNQASQLRKNQREEVLSKKRSRGTQFAAPFLCAIVSLSGEVDMDGIMALIKQCDETATVTTNDMGITHISVPRFKQRFSFVSAPRSDLYATLDAAKVADSALFVVDAGTGVDNHGHFLLTSLNAQGFPAPVIAVTGVKSLPHKRQNDAKKAVKNMLKNRFPEEKIHSLDTPQEALLILRAIRSKPMAWRDNRPHIIAEEVNFELDSEESNTGTLKLSGYIRGQALSANGLIHLPGWGDFQMSQIDAPNDPYPLTRSNNNKEQDVEMDEGTRVLEKAVPSQQESLQASNEIDPMEGEQTFPTEEELMEAEENLKKRKEVKRVPKGTSSYQASWITDDVEFEDDEDDDDDEEDIDMDAVAAEEESSEGEEEGDEEEWEDQEDQEDETASRKGVTWGLDEKYDADYDMEEDMKMMHQLKESREHEMFPDEIDTPQDQSARERFARYRGLKSFRTSPWDPKEELPQDYARIFQFANYRATKKRVMGELETRTGAMPGWYVTIHIINVPRELMESYKAGTPIVAFGLLQHEQKMSVLHFLLKRQPTSTCPIKSKQRMIFHVGFRRFAAGPIFSQHTHAGKHKFERYFPVGGTVVASVFAPIMFPPASVMAFLENANGEHELVATGNLLSINPDRIVVKRVVLSGHPFKINRRAAVVRFMFFNPEDIIFFKPVELGTKFGRHGHIKQSLGTHGHMKCIFDGQLKSQDTVLMRLYKRVYPKWSYDGEVRAPASVAHAADLPQAMDELFD